MKDQLLLKYEFWIHLFQVITTSLIALMVAGINWQQHRLERRKYLYTTYERKLKIFKSTRKIISQTLAAGNFPVGDCEDFWEARTESLFLFDEKISNFLDEIWNHGVNLHTAESLLNSSSVDREKIVAKSAAEIDWFANKITTLRDRFSPYLKLN